jgi:hypothetical protein
MRPQPGSYPAYYDNYIPLVKDDNVVEALIDNWKRIRKFAWALPHDKDDYAYAEGKWTMKQVVHHMVDTERIISYRALRFARKDPQAPLAFEENDYAANAGLERRSMNDILEEFETVRGATLSLFRSFSPAALLSVGNTTMGPTTVVALGYLICGHATHHANVITERYLKISSPIKI